MRHHKHPRNLRALADATHRACLRNPVCGDEVEVCVQVQGTQVGQATFQGQACAIARASASILTDAIAGLSLTQAEHLAHAVIASVREGTHLPASANKDAVAIGGVHRFPGRHRCATLPWEALQQALKP